MAFPACTVQTQAAGASSDWPVFVFPIARPSTTTTSPASWKVWGTTAKVSKMVGVIMSRSLRISLEIPAEPAALRAWREQTLYRLLLRATRAETTETLKRLRARGHTTVTMVYTNLLANLDTEGTTISALARRAGVTRQAASQVLLEIERDGYVTREPDPLDGRAVLVRQTPKGRALLQDALEVVAELEAEYAQHLSHDDLDALRQTLAALLDHIDPAGTLGRD